MLLLPQSHDFDKRALFFFVWLPVIGNLKAIYLTTYLLRTVSLRWKHSRQKHFFKELCQLPFPLFTWTFVSSKNKPFFVCTKMILCPPLFPTKKLQTILLKKQPIKICCLFFSFFLSSHSSPLQALSWTNGRREAARIHTSESWIRTTPS